jgi:hypothetical protein
MSLTLPPRPSLDHLKKQAKDRLQELQATAPGTQLADAQHALARDYGFPSWPKLKARVEASSEAAAHADAPAGPTPPGGSASPPQGGGDSTNIFPRMTDRAKRALFFSRYEASQLGSLLIEPEHVLLGVIRSREGVREPAAAAIPLAEILAELLQAGEKKEAIGNTVMIPFTEATKQVFVKAAAEADERQHQHIGTLHVLLGLLQSPGIGALVGPRGLTYDGLAREPMADGAD